MGVVAKLPLSASSFPSPLSIGDGMNENKMSGSVTVAGKWTKVIRTMAGYLGVCVCVRHSLGTACHWVPYAPPPPLNG